MAKLKKDKSFKSIKTNEADNSAILAFEELLDLSTTKLSDIKLETITLEDDEINYVNINDTVELDEDDLTKIINRAKKHGEVVRGSRKLNPLEIEEEEIINKALKEGKSRYDSDVLRELILKRQKERRKEIGLTNILKNAKNNKDNYDK
ncbi:hypothetical protein SGLAD_v1c04370 [Spiroplasma gladiatoris]|uniref:Uncharacterized protein n=1 Tax=Spiroplasma gladiatoris TaxID=2143 RepID=A0A4P7AJ01_9MOLU|nr:hypothetical protein [Spiroplasma gladiatoris]QBQ07636.1 hypothetical protein SGLAD_v1c04370 [Spiroplasma gladiatoris]